MDALKQGIKQCEGMLVFVVALVRAEQFIFYEGGYRPDGAQFMSCCTPDQFLWIRCSNGLQVGFRQTTR